MASTIIDDRICTDQDAGNLISNSLKFTEDGSVTIGARLDSETNEKATLTFWVKDTGIGISPEQKQKLFQPFSQADTSTARKYGGSGLGLSICKSLIETMMKGTIELESQQNVGTTAWFTVTFDKARANATAGDPRALPDSFSRRSSDNVNREPSPNPYLDLSLIPKDQLRISIAEDNAINQKIAIQYVQRLGYTTVDAYENGQKALEGLRQKAKEGRPYHIILMDVQMPVMDGYDATRWIRKDSMEEVRKILVIAMTASAIQGDREKCLAAGMNDYLAKPVRADVLRKKLDTYVNPERKLSVSESSVISQTPGASPPPPSLPHPTGPATAVNGTVNSAASLPLRENPSYSKTSDGGSTATYALSTKTSNENRLSDAGSIDSVGGGSSGKPRNKLTKKHASDSLEGAKDKDKERPKSVLKKKNPMQSRESGGVSPDEQQ